MPEFIGRPQLPTGMAEMAAKLRAMVGQELGQGISDLGKGIGNMLGESRKAGAQQDENVQTEYLKTIRELTLDGRLERVSPPTVDMNAMLPRLSNTMNLAPGIGNPQTTSIPGTESGGAMTTQDIWGSMGGKGEAPGTMARVLPKRATDASKSRILVDDTLIKDYGGRGINLSPLKGREISVNVLVNADRAYAALEQRRSAGKDKDALRYFKLAMPQAVNDPRYFEASTNNDIDAMDSVVKEYEGLVKNAEARGVGKGGKKDEGGEVIDGPPKELIIPKGRLAARHPSGTWGTISEAQRDKAVKAGYTVP